jgi:hypothetical protein
VKPAKLLKPGTSTGNEWQKSTKLLKPGTLPDSGKIDQEGGETKARKAENAEVPEYLWHQHILRTVEEFGQRLRSRSYLGQQESSRRECSSIGNTRCSRFS